MFSVVYNLCREFGVYLLECCIVLNRFVSDVYVFVVYSCIYSENMQCFVHRVSN